MVRATRVPLLETMCCVGLEANAHPLLSCLRNIIYLVGAIILVRMIAYIALTRLNYLAK